MDQNNTSELQQRLKKLAIAEGIFDVALDPIIVIDRRGHIQHFNAAGEALFGYVSDEVVGKNVSVLVPSPHKEQHDTYIQNYLDTGKAHIIGKGRDVQALHREGGLIPVHLSITKVEVEGEPFFIGTVRDMSKQIDFDLIAS